MSSFNCLGPSFPCQSWAQPLGKSFRRPSKRTNGWSFVFYGWSGVLYGCPWGQACHLWYFFNWFLQLCLSPGGASTVLEPDPWAAAGSPHHSLRAVRDSQRFAPAPATRCPVALRSLPTERARLAQLVWPSLGRNLQGRLWRTLVGRRGWNRGSGEKQRLFFVSGFMCWTPSGVRETGKEHWKVRWCALSALVLIGRYTITTLEWRLAKVTNWPVPRAFCRAFTAAKWRVRGTCSWWRGWRSTCCRPPPSSRPAPSRWAPSASRCLPPTSTRSTTPAGSRRRRRRTTPPCAQLACSACTPASRGSTTRRGKVRLALVEPLASKHLLMVVLLVVALCLGLWWWCWWWWWWWRWRRLRWSWWGW